MTGAIAGTAIFRARRANRLQVLTVTVNNDCQLACSHCYLQYDRSGRQGLIAEEFLQVIDECAFDHLAIVGKEPLVNKASADIVSRMVSACVERGKTVSLITNGVGLRLLSDETLRDLCYVDVSADGAYDFYERYRGPKWGKLVANIEDSYSRGLREVNILSVANAETIHALEPLIDAVQRLPVTRHVISPYVLTANEGHNAVGGVPLKQLLQKLSSCSTFMSASKCSLLVDDLHASQSGLFGQDFLRYVKAIGMANKVTYIAGDPLEYGIVRVTYDKLLLTPLDSIHPARYGEMGHRISSWRTAAGEIAEFFKAKSAALALRPLLAG